MATFSGTWVRTGAESSFRLVNETNVFQVNSEFYTGWLDFWGGGHAHGNTTAIVNTLTDMMNMGASVNM